MRITNERTTNASDTLTASETKCYIANGMVPNAIVITMDHSGLSRHTLMELYVLNAMAASKTESTSDSYTHIIQHNVHHREASALRRHTGLPVPSDSVDESDTSSIRPPVGSVDSNLL